MQTCIRAYGEKHVSWSPGLVAAVEAEVEPGVEDEVQPTLVTPCQT